MRMILAITRSRPDAGADAPDRVRRAFAVLAGGPPALHLTTRSAADPAAVDEVFATAAEAGDVISEREAVFAAVLQRSGYTTSGAVLDGRRILDGVRADATALLRSIAPPFGACYRAAPDGPVSFATDPCGLRHLYHWQGDGWAVACSSSLVLALVVGAPVDEHAMGVFSVVGNHLLDQTPFAGVRRLDAGTVCHLRAGTVSFDVFDRQVAAAPVGGNRATMADRGVTVMRDALDAILQAYPDAGLELSGGFDSRAVLAAVPKGARKGRMALTLGTPGNADIRIASDLARREGLVHHVVDLTKMNDLPAERILELARTAARRRDCTANPMGTGVLEWIEAQVDQVPRLNGQNSEFGRAHLYPGQRHQETFDDDKIDLLAKWRIMQNHSTNGAVLTPAFAEAGRAAAHAELRRQFRALDVDWLRSLDEYYFQSRMERWAGIDYTAVGYDRVVLSPFFHRGYLDWVRACDPQDRRASRVFAAMFDRLDPELAALPLHIGVSPHEIARGGPVTAVKRFGIGTAMTTAKVWQRVRRVGRGSAGADRFAQMVVAAWRQVGDPLDQLARYPFVDLDGVRRVVGGEESVSSATIAFLMNLEVLADVTDAFERTSVDAPGPAAARADSPVTAEPGS